MVQATHPAKKYFLKKKKKMKPSALIYQQKI